MSEEKKKTAKKDVAAKDVAEKKAAPKAAEAKAEAPKAAAKKAAPKAAKKADTGVKKQGKLIEDIRLYDVIVRPLITEKATLAAEQGKVVFKINPTANKQDVKRAVEQLFGVKVVKVNTVLTKGKQKRFRGQLGQRSDMRKAIVTLAAGQSIDLASGLK
jgi:large subunit ribosomal protein L23